MFGMVLVYLAAVNTIAFLAFRLDKARAIAGARRIREDTLLFLAVMGGWVGAKIAQRRYRHKTRKQPFALLLNMVVCLWIIGVSLPLAAVGIHDLPKGAVASLFHTEHDTLPERHTPKFFQSVRH